MGPGESVVKDVDGCIGEVLGFNDLDKQSPSRIVTSFNGTEKIFDVIIGFFTSQS